jgi:hypothetical protein
MPDFFISLWLFLRVRWFHFKEIKEIRCRFPGFIRYEKAFARAYRFRNPFRICKKFLRERGEKWVDAYGETPLPVFAQIAHECALSREDTLIELGCGRGRGVFFLSHLIGCRVIGVDWIPDFIQHAESISESFFPRLPISFHCQEMRFSNFSDVSAIYLYGTCLSDEEISSLVSRFESMPPSTKIITVSYPLRDYSARFFTLKQFTASFPWGDAEIYLNCNNSLVRPLA